MIVQKELVAIYDYEVPVPEDPFSFRLEGDVANLLI